MSEPDLSHQWISDLDGDIARAIVTLVDHAAGDDGTLGYAGTMSAASGGALPTENTFSR